ncbi:MAG: OmpA family protein [Desulfobacterales bacterium]|nr:OmpA family protein [Desulfobacterales bacterium]
MAKFKKNFYACMIFLLIVGVDEVYAANDMILPESFKSAALFEKNSLEGTIIEYEHKIVESKEDLVKETSHQEWLILKIEKIRDQTRQIPIELTKSYETSNSKIQVISQEINRMESLIKKHGNALKQLDKKVHNKYKNNDLGWWTINEKVAMLIGIPVAHENSILKQELEKKIKEKGLEGWVKILEQDSNIVLVNQLPILFASAKADLTKENKEYLKKFSLLVKDYPVKIKIKGFADPRKIKTDKFPSNRELGAYRAASVSHELVKNGISPAIIAVTSYGEYGLSEKEEKNPNSALSRSVEISAFFENK